MKDYTTTMDCNVMESVIGGSRRRPESRLETLI